MPELWVPGATGPSLEDFVARIVRRIEVFASQRGWDRAFVEVTLHDGTRLALYSISPEPGYGMVTLCPYPEDEEQPWPKAGEGGECPPEELIVPVGTIMRIRLGELDERESRFGFSAPTSA